MNPSPPNPTALIVRSIIEKAGVKRQVYSNTLAAFDLIRETLSAMCGEINLSVRSADRRIKLEFKDSGRFECELRAADDVLLFSMHSNVFGFDRDHSLWKLPYVQEQRLNAYCGVINIYNFLTDSFRYNRNDDLGYLIGRLFVNRESHYFVEGKRQMAFLYNNFGKATVSRPDIRRIIESALLYALDFDLLAPPYDMVKIATVAQLNTKIQSARIQTGKRLGFRFNADDVLEE